MQLPGPVRAVVGLLATAADEARHLPDRAIELPMLAVSSALQVSLRAQQRYARLAARGDDVINRRPPTDEAPAWATFDAPIAPEELNDAQLDDPDPALRARAASQLLEELLGQAEPGASDGSPGPMPKTQRKATAKRTAAKSTAARRSSPAKKAGAAKRPPSKGHLTDLGGADDADAGKTINKPRHIKPSRFDTVEDE